MLFLNETKVFHIIIFLEIMVQIQCIFSIIDISVSHHRAWRSTAHYSQFPEVGGLSGTESHRVPRRDKQFAGAVCRAPAGPETGP